MNDTGFKKKRKQRQKRAGNPKIAVAYLRVSTEDQRLGPEVQRESIESWAKREGVTIAAWFVDQGTSGGTEAIEREVFREALLAVQTHGAGILVVAKRDRLARDVVVAALAERLAAGVGATVVSAAGEGNGNEAGDHLQRQMMDVFAGHERRIIRDRTKSALAIKFARGERIGGIPYGFSSQDQGVRTRKDGTISPLRILVPNAEEQAVLGEVHALRDEGATLQAIAEELEMRGRRSRRGKPFSVSAVHAMLRAKVAS